MTEQSLVITGVDAQTSVGLDITQTAAGIRAGVSGFTEHPFYASLVRDPEVDAPELVTAAMCGQLSDMEFDTGRLLELIMDPFSRVIENADMSRADMGRTFVGLALPEKGVSTAELDLAQPFLNQLTGQLALPKSSDISAIKLGSLGFFYFLKEAVEKLGSGAADFAVISATDSFVLDKRLPLLDKHWRLKTDRNPFGFIAGEAASVVLLETEQKAQQRGASILAKVAGFGLGKESNPITQDKPSTGEGLATAIQACFANEERSQKVKWVISALNGEQYPAYEWGVVYSRLFDWFSADTALQLLGDVIGEVGSAQPGIAIGCIIKAFEKDYAPDLSALVVAANDEGIRGAMTICSP